MKSKALIFHFSNILRSFNSFQLNDQLEMSLCNKLPFSPLNEADKKTMKKRSAHSTGKQIKRDDDATKRSNDEFNGTRRSKMNASKPKVKCIDNKRSITRAKNFNNNSIVRRSNWFSNVKECFSIEFSILTRSSHYSIHTKTPVKINQHFQLFQMPQLNLAELWNAPKRKLKSIFTWNSTKIEWQTCQFSVDFLNSWTKQ